MNNFILTPVFAFLIYFLVVSAASGLGRLFSARGRKSQFKSEPYASGEDYDPVPAAPGYRQFFVIALFFAVLHLGIIMIGRHLPGLGQRQPRDVVCPFARSGALAIYGDHGVAACAG